MLVSLSRRATKPRSLRHPRGQVSAITKKVPFKFSPGLLESILEPVSAAGNLFASLFDLVDPIQKQEDHPEIPGSVKGESETTSIDEIVESKPLTQDSVKEDSDANSVGEVVESKPLAPYSPKEGSDAISIGENTESKPPAPESVLEDSDVTFKPTESKPFMPTRQVPSIPTTPTTDSVDTLSSPDQYPLGQTLPMAPLYNSPPMASPASFEEFDEFEASEYTDSDLAFTGSMLDAAKTPTIPFARPPSAQTRLKLVGNVFPKAIDGTSPATPIDELSDLSEVILSPVRTRSMASDTSQSQKSAVQREDAGHQQQEIPPRSAIQDRGPGLYGFRGDYSVQAALTNSLERPVTTSPSRQTSPTLTHSQAENIPSVDQNREQEAKSSPPPRPIRSPNRPSPASSRHNSLTSVASLPLPPPVAVVRQAHRNPIPIPTATYQAEKSTQPRLNPSPKILAMIQKFEGTSRETEDLGNVFVGSTRSLSVSANSRRGSVSSTKKDQGYSSPWTSYNTPPSSRPGTPGSISEFGETMYPDGGPSNMEIAREVRWKGDGGTSDMVNQANWDLRPVVPQRRGSNSSVYRLVPHMLMKRGANFLLLVDLL